MNHLLIYTENTSNRLTYTFDLLLKDLMGLDYELTSDKDFFVKSDRPKFSYASQPVGNELFFGARNLLFEHGTDLQPLGVFEYKKIRGFFSTPKPSYLPFDLFASTFMMVSRYEEYLPSKTDQFGRYRGGQSMARQGDFLDKPMVNYYALELKKFLGERFAQLRFKQQRFEYLPTIDVDMAFSYLGKGVKRNVGGMLRSFMLSDFKEIRERIEVLAGRKRDPFDTFNYMSEVLDQYSITPFFFFLVADDGKFDKSIPYTNKRFGRLVKEIALKYPAGIHLSYQSHSISDLPAEEIKRLEGMAGKKIFQNRFHYLKFNLPISYQRLIRYGITEDYSMGYAPRTGFRAGISTPFYFFDVLADEVTNLKVYPLAFMDTTFTQYKRISAQAALEKIREMMGYVVETGGLFTGLWHNSSFTESKEWKGWRHVFETVAKEASELMRDQ